MFLMKAQFMHNLFGIVDDSPESEAKERKTASILQVMECDGSYLLFKVF